MGSTVKQIIGSFEDIGKDIAREAVKVPADLAGKALESMGTPKAKGQQTNTKAAPVPESAASPEKPLPPRQWLMELAGTHKKQQEPSVQERLQQEEHEKKEKEAKQAAVARQMAPIVTGSSKPKRGNLYGIKQKSSSEMSKNTRQD